MTLTVVDWILWKPALRQALRRKGTPSSTESKQGRKKPIYTSSVFFNIWLFKYFRTHVHILNHLLTENNKEMFVFFICCQRQSSFLLNIYDKISGFRCFRSTNTPQIKHYKLFNGLGNRSL